MLGGHHSPWRMHAGLALFTMVDTCWVGIIHHGGCMMGGGVHHLQG